MVFFICILPLFIIQFVLLMCNKQWFHKHRVVLLILPALFLVLLIASDLSRAYEGIPEGELAHVRGTYILIDCMYVLVLLVPFAFTFIHHNGLRGIIIAALVLIMPVSYVTTTNADVYDSFLYEVQIRHYRDIPREVLLHDVTGPYVEFEWNWPRDPYAD